MGRKYLYFWPIYLIQDIYWCFIPMNCRECMFLNDCRDTWWHGRKCFHGCVKLNIMRERKREEDREDYLENLLKYAEEEESKGRLR